MTYVCLGPLSDATFVEDVTAIGEPPTLERLSMVAATYLSMSERLTDFADARAMAEETGQTIPEVLADSARGWVWLMEREGFVEESFDGTVALTFKGSMFLACHGPLEPLE
jgi:hypothetical protein